MLRFRKCFFFFLLKNVEKWTYVSKSIFTNFFKPKLCNNYSQLISFTFFLAINIVYMFNFLPVWILQIKKIKTRTKPFHKINNWWENIDTLKLKFKTNWSKLITSILWLEQWKLRTLMSALLFWYKVVWITYLFLTLNIKNVNWSYLIVTFGWRSFTVYKSDQKIYSFVGRLYVHYSALSLYLRMERNKDKPKKTSFST